jgi:hydrogenase expression/formation protein HypC
MCLAVPGKITELRDEGGVPMARVDFGGISRDACMAYLPEAQIGDYVLVHVGFAISRMDEEEAARTLADLETLSELQREEEARESLGDAQSPPGPRREP